MKNQKPKNQATNPRPRKAVKDELNDRVRLFFKTGGSSILVAENLTVVAAKIISTEFQLKVRGHGGKCKGHFYSVR